MFRRLLSDRKRKSGQSAGKKPFFFLFLFVFFNFTVLFTIIFYLIVEEIGG